MKAGVIRRANGKIEIEERDRGKPGVGDVLIRVRACGVCHGDLMVQKGEFPFVTYPVVPGHEIAGVIEDIGEGVDWLQAGERVGLSGLYSTCGHCEQCIAGNENLCAKWNFTGVTTDGGYQEFLVAPALFVAPLPNGLDFAEAAPFMCAGLTVYSALRHAGFESGQKVAVIGLGGLGSIGVQLVRAMGGRVSVISSSERKEAEARELGAELFISAKSAPSADVLRTWDGGADIILLTAPSLQAASSAFPGLAPDGTLVLLGISPGEIAVNPWDLCMGRRRLMGSPAGSRRELRETLQFAGAHKLHPRVKRYPLEAANDALEEMHQGSLCGRAVIVMN